MPKENPPPETARNATQRLVWPDMEGRVIDFLREIKGSKGIRYRSLTSELTHGTGSLKIGADGIPIIERNVSSYAFSLGGWKKTQEIVASTNSLDEFVAECDADEIPSPLIWTSYDPLSAAAFGVPERDMILMVLQMDQRRERFVHPGIEPFSEEDEIRFREAVRRRKPFVFEYPDEDFDGLEETLVGPYIAKTEILGFVKVRDADKSRFRHVFGEIFKENTD